MVQDKMRAGISRITLTEMEKELASLPLPQARDRTFLLAWLKLNHPEYDKALRSYLIKGEIGGWNSWRKKTI